ncbi:MAG: EamA family transporter [Candidatus Lokiarchaeota archaeon]|nr:EamA family transporter [Candidatus Lokiarchaeota archaeon]
MILSFDISMVFPTLAGLFYGSQYVPQKKLGEVDSRNYNLSMSIGIVAAASIFFILFSIYTMSIISIIPILLALISGIIWQIGNRLSIEGIKRIGMGKTSALLNLVSVFSFLFGILFYSEQIDPFKIIGLPIIILGAVIVALTRKAKSKVDWRGILSVIGATVIISIFNIISVESMVSNYNPTIPFYATVFFLSIGAVVGGLIFNIRGKRLRNWINEGKRFHFFAVIAGLIWCCGILLTSFSLANFGLSFGVPIIQTVMIIGSVSWGIIYFKEFRDKKNLILFIIGVIISIFGITFFGLSSVLVINF